MTQKCIMASCMIAIGCIANLVAIPSMVGAFLFPVGLIVICGRGYRLATGMVESVATGASSIVDWLNVFCKNIFTILIIGLCGQFFGIVENAELIVNGINQLSEVEVFARAVACGFLMTEAVAGWRRGSALTTYFCVVVFVFCGFRHCIADAFYITVANAWANSLLAYMFIVVGNFIGGLIPALFGLTQQS